MCFGWMITLADKLTPQEEGIAFEKRFAKKFGGEEVPRSGAGIYHKLDVRDNKFLWSLKWTGNKSFSITSKIWKEVHDEVYGPGGLGLDFMPGLAIELEGETYAFLKMDDLVDLLESDVKVFSPTKKSELRAKAAVPRLLRQEV